MTSVHVRRATSNDEAGIRALGSRLSEGAAPWRPPEAFAMAAQSWLDDSLAEMDDDHPVWVAVQDESVVGVAAADIRRHFTGQVDCYLGELVVSTDHEGEGIGRTLVATVEAWAGSRGAPRVTLETGAANARARQFYSSLGYLEEEVTLTRVMSDVPTPSE